METFVARLRRLLDGRTIVLIGMPGVGKSTLGRGIADRLGWGFADLDQEPWLNGMTVPDHPIRIGLDYELNLEFMKQQTRALNNAVTNPDIMIVATGGSAVLDRYAQATLQSPDCLVVHLFENVEEDDPVWEERSIFYDECRDFLFRTKFKNEEQDAKDLIHAINEYLIVEAHKEGDDPDQPSENHAVENSIQDDLKTIVELVGEIPDETFSKIDRILGYWHAEKTLERPPFIEYLSQFVSQVPADAVVKGENDA